VYQQKYDYNFLPNGRNPFTNKEQDFIKFTTITITNTILTVFIIIAIISGLHHRLVVWLSGNALVSINVVTLRQAQLLPGWVTVFGQVNYLSM